MKEQLEAMMKSIEDWKKKHGNAAPGSKEWEFAATSAFLLIGGLQAMIHNLLKEP